MAKDLREFLQVLETERPGDLLRVRRPVSPHFEAAAILAKLESVGRYPAVVFEHIQGSSLPVVSNIHADLRRLYAALELKNGDIPTFIREYAHREDHPIPPLLVSDGPVKEVVQVGQAVNLLDLPVLTYHEKDAAPYITAGIGVMRDPDSGVRNAGIYRLMLKDRNRLGVLFSQTAHGHYIWKKHEKQDRPTEIAIVIGHHPGFYLGCLSFTPLEVDEFAVAGAILGEPVEVVRCERLDLEVPAFAEIVLEGEILPGVREKEAPFGEFAGTYGPQRDGPVIEIRAVTRRRDAYYQESFAGHADNLLLGLPRCSYIWKTVRAAAPGVRAVYMPLSARCRFTCYIAMEKFMEGEPKLAAMAAFVADPFLKFVIVVDEDVDISRDDQVLHAVATRVRADTDTFLATHAKGNQLDPAAYQVGGPASLVTKLGVDATRKANYPEEITVPGTEAINLAEWLSP
ncbi:MAG: UbiD family decarboxylase [Deltaproteobacteria bacterium]|nr:UbiD family decarboxylase [Deltaproteobacteria bacterium]